jgi:hypothetical protein
LFYSIAQSLEESRYLLILADDLGYGDAKPLLDEAAETARSLEGYVQSMCNPAREATHLSAGF